MPPRAPIEDAEHAVPAPTDAPIVLPEIPTADLSLSMDFTTFIDPDSVECVLFRLQPHIASEY